MGKQSVTIKDVARKAHFSTATVSRVINHDPKVSRETKAAVEAAMKEMGYRVNTIARSLRSSTTHTVAILSPEFRNDFFMAVAEGIEEELRTEGYTTFILNSRESIEEEKARISLMVEKQVDGAIIIPAGDRGEHYSMLVQEGIPFVLVDRIVEGMQADAVLSDNINGAYQAVDLAIRDGAQRIGCIGGDQKLTSARERYTGYERALRMHGIKVDQRIIAFSDMHADSGYRIMGELLEADPELRYVFAVNLFLHLGAEKYLLEHSIGNLIRFIAFDEALMNIVLSHDYITVRQPLEEIGKTAAMQLLQRIRSTEESPPRICRLQPEIISSGFSK